MIVDGYRYRTRALYLEALVGCIFSSMVVLLCWSIADAVSLTPKSQVTASWGFTASLLISVTVTLIALGSSEERRRAAADRRMAVTAAVLSVVNSIASTATVYVVISANVDLAWDRHLSVAAALTIVAVSGTPTLARRYAWPGPVGRHHLSDPADHGAHPDPGSGTANPVNTGTPWPRSPNR